MHGIGNDYIYINCLSETPGNLDKLAIRLSDRHSGIGGDGIILICPSQVADFKMRIFNADGSEAKMCGNGCRCVGKYVYDKGLTDKTRLTLETLSGIRNLRLKRGESGDVDMVTVDMGEPVTMPAEIPVISDNGPLRDFPVETSCGVLPLTSVGMGNPHGVVFVETIDDDLVAKAGPELERHPMWPDRANIEFARVDSAAEITMRVWERGSGETMACGTGACATAVAAAITGRCGRKVTVRLLGGDLEIDWANDGHVYMTGPATTVFEGTIDLKSNGQD